MICTNEANSTPYDFLDCHHKNATSQVFPWRKKHNELLSRLTPKYHATMSYFVIVIRSLRLIHTHIRVWDLRIEEEEHCVTSVWQPNLYDSPLINRRWWIILNSNQIRCMKATLQSCKYAMFWSSTVLLWLFVFHCSRLTSVFHCHFRSNFLY